LIEAVMVDAYGESEQATAFPDRARGESDVSIRATARGESVVVEKIDPCDGG
jgi:hypothetical protein